MENLRETNNSDGEQKSIFITRDGRPGQKNKGQICFWTHRPCKDEFGRYNGKGFFDMRNATTVLAKLGEEYLPGPGEIIEAFDVERIKNMGPKFKNIFNWDEVDYVKYTNSLIQTAKNSQKD